MVRDKGIFDSIVEKATINGNRTPQYRVWYSMIERCFCEKMHKKNPTYIGCAIDDLFLSYTNFVSWAEKQIGYLEHDFDLDKDLLSKGLKIYSPATCVFIPSEINKAIAISRRKNRDLPTGVFEIKDKSRYGVQLSVGNKRVYLGCYKTKQDAYEAYKAGKKDAIRNLAIKWKGKIDQRAFDALYDFEIMD